MNLFEKVESARNEEKAKAQYLKTDQQWVKQFLQGNKLSKLSVREGSKYV